MIKSGHISYIIGVLMLLLGMKSFAQDLPKMPADPSVKYGVLPNGTNYYVLENADTKGVADFALVQKRGGMSESVFAELPLLGVSPRKYFADNEIVPCRGSFLEKRNNAAIFRFGSVMASAKPELMDSTLLIMMGMVNASAKECAPSESAVIVSGDVKSVEVVEKLKMLSYMTPVGAEVETEKYCWQDSETVFEVVKGSGNVSEISLAWRLPRTPEQFAGTIQPAVHEKLIYELGTIAGERICRAFEKGGIPYAGVFHKHISSFVTDSDEELKLVAQVGVQDVDGAAAAMADALSSIHANAITIAERNLAESSFIHFVYDQTRHPVRADSDNIELCINAFLNGVLPFSEAARYGFHCSKDVNDTTETMALNRLASSFMSIEKNAHVRLSSSAEITSEDFRNIFVSAWDSTSLAGVSRSVLPSDTFTSQDLGKKLPVVFMRKEHMSGGYLWTFGNGLRVVYKKMDTKGRIHWALGLSEGYASVLGLEAGEGAFIADMLKLNRISGMPWDDFVACLESREIYLEASVGLYNSIITGSAPSYELSTVVSALGALASERTFDREAFNRYRRNEWLRMEQVRGTSRVVVDSLMCPEYRYSRIKSPGKMTEELPSKACALFDEMFSKVNNGVLVIIGDRDEAIVRTQLRETLGHFRTQTAAEVSPRVSYQPISGYMTHHGQGDSNEVYLAMSQPLPLTIGNYALTEVAGLVLKKKLEAALGGSGMYPKVYSDRKITPHERFNVMVVLEEVPGTGMGDVEETARKIVRDQLSPEGLSDITKEQVDACKKWLKHNRSVRSKKPEYWVNALLLRYLEGKDFTTGYDARIDAVSVDQVRALLSSLDNAGKVEYIIRRK